MITWRQLTEADLLTAVSGAELDQWRALALAAGQADPVAPTITQVTEQIRSYAQRVVTIGPKGTIPESLLTEAVDLTVARIENRVGVSATDACKDAARAALDRLKGLKGVDVDPTATPPSRVGWGGDRKICI